MIEPTFVNNYNDTYTVSNTCQCGMTTTALVSGPAVFQWRQGAHAQTAFAGLLPAEREALFISGVCSACWNALFANDEDF